ncbi:MAG: leucyl/phenylalanyl-tRNA--protein transferase [Nitrospirae bacterium]|nr:leucyl/phenylalanyl-tRNA--protein transferase [Nitrospirota bacterium]
MSIFLLSDKLFFPSPAQAEADGLLAVGGDLSQKRLLKAYSMGIFPWYSEDSPLLWWSPDPRLVLFPEELNVSRSLRQCIRKGLFTVTMNKAFEQVMRACAEANRKGQSGTWITEEMIRAYTGLHSSGYAHSVEAWYEGQLVGGLYGVMLGRIFFGESMFARKSNASKVAFAVFVEQMLPKGLTLIDCQVRTEHLASLGAREISRTDFLSILSKAIG